MTPAVQTSVRAGTSVPPESTAVSPSYEVERLPDMDLDAALLEATSGVDAEPPRDLGQDRRSGIDEHPALGRIAQGRVVAQRRVGEVVELGERLDSRVARADEDEPELRRRPARRGRVESLEHVVAERDRVGEVLEAAAVLGQPGHREDAVDGAERDDEPLVA